MILFEKNVFKTIRDVFILDLQNKKQKVRSNINIIHSRCYSQEGPKLSTCCYLHFYVSKGHVMPFPHHYKISIRSNSKVNQYGYLTPSLWSRWFSHMVQSHMSSVEGNPRPPGVFRWMEDWFPGLHTQKQLSHMNKHIRHFVQRDLHLEKKKNRNLREPRHSKEIDLNLQKS